MDQTRFKTLQTAIEVARELYLEEAQRQIKGGSFTLSLGVDVPGQPGIKIPLDLIVDRIHLAKRDSPTYRLANDDTVVRATARLEPEGESFDISVMFRLGQTQSDGAPVFVSKDMERIILERRRQAIDRALDQILENETK